MNTVRVRVRSPFQPRGRKLPSNAIFDAVLARQFDHGEEAAKPGVGVERQRDAGEIDQLGGEQAFGDAVPVGQLEQVARRRVAAPMVEVPRCRRIGVDQGKSRQPAGRPQDQVARNSFGGGQRQDAVRIGIVAERAREGDVETRARQVDRGVEGVAAVGQREAAVARRGSVRA